MTKVLVIWEEIPEESKLYLLELDGEELKKTLEAHGQLVGCTDTKSDGVEFLSEFLVGKTPIMDSSKILGKKAAPINVKELGAEFIVWSGLML